MAGAALARKVAILAAYSMKLRLVLKMASLARALAGV